MIYFSKIEHYLLKSVARWAVAMLLSAAVLTGCTSTSKQADVHPYLDEGTGATVTGFARPMIFSHEAPMLAAFARDYVHVGPMEVNRQGRIEFVLWMDWWSTIDRGRRVGLDLPDEVILMIDGKPMELARAEHGPGFVQMPYAGAVNGGQTAFYAVTRDQVRLLLNAQRAYILADGVAYRARQPADHSCIEFNCYIDEELAIQSALAHE
jgi:hypothetical protein